MSKLPVLLCLCAVLASCAAQLCGSLVQPTCGGGIGQAGLYGLSSNGVGLLSGGLGQVGLNGISSNGVGLLSGAGLGYGSQGVEALSVVSGSSYAPNGISVFADNLEIAGPVAVSGGYPILGAVSLGGNLPTGGQGQVAYSSAPGVGLSSGGCGYGLASAQPSVSAPLANNYLLSGVNGLGGTQFGLPNLGCGCGGSYF